MACIIAISQPVLAQAAGAKSNNVVTVPVKSGYADFSWGVLFENTHHDLIISYAYRLGAQWELHYFNVDSMVDLDPDDAPKVAADTAALKKLKSAFGLRPIAADIFETFDLPDGSTFGQEQTPTSSCGWPYPSFIFIRPENGITEELALFVPVRPPRRFMLKHECERSRGTDSVRLNFDQPLLEGIYTPRGEFFVLCEGIPSVSCEGTPRLLHLVVGGLPDMLREFGVIAVPADIVRAAYQALAEDGLPAQQAIDQAEAAVTERASTSTDSPR